MQENDKIFNKEISCPNCKVKFSTKKPFTSKLRIVTQEIDGHKIYKENSPYLYEINVCPKCGMAFSNNINKRLTKEKKDKLRGYFAKVQNFEKYCNQRTHADAIRASKLAMLISYLIKEPIIYIASLYLKISWLYRENDDIENEKKYLLKAKNAFEEAFVSENIERYGITDFAYYNILSEINRKLDNFEDAGRYYIKLFQCRNVPSVIKQQAQNNWYDYKEKRKNR